MDVFGADTAFGRREFLRSAGALSAAAVVLPRWSRLAKPPRGGGPASAATTFMDDLWDDGAGLIRTPFRDSPHLVRESSWYALGLLQRDGPGDREHARRALDTVVSRQFDSPGAPFHGTYARYGEDGTPPADAQPFREFDPNWRQFIGTALALAVERFGARLGGSRAAIEQSIELAATSEPADRVQPDYSNIALMHAWLLGHAGDKRAGEELARAVAERYRGAKALDEYNSPTYDGVSLYALRLWRTEPPSRVFAQLGKELETGLWSDIAGTYHAGLRNACGPYSRAVGMDLKTYVALVGLWIWGAVGEQRAPVPDTGTEFEHAADLCFGPFVDLLGADPPPATTRSLRRFTGTRLVRAGGTSDWHATSWLGKDLILGGHTGPAVRIGGDQLIPATIHWKDGWVRMRATGTQVDAVARPNRLDITVGDPGPVVITIGVPGLDPAAVGEREWSLPGLHVDVTCDSFPLAPAAATSEGVEVRYPPTTLRLDADTV